MAITFFHGHMTSMCKLDIVVTCKSHPRKINKTIVETVQDEISGHLWSAKTFHSMA